MSTPLLAAGVVLTAVCAMRGVDAFVTDLQRFVELKFRKGHAKCPDCNGVGRVRYVTVETKSRRQP